MSGCADADFHDDWYWATSTNCGVSKWFDVSFGGGALVVIASLLLSASRKVAKKLAEPLVVPKNARKSEVSRFDSQARLQIAVIAACVSLAIAFSLVMASAIDGVSPTWFRLFSFVSTALYYEVIRRVGGIASKLVYSLLGAKKPVWWKSYPFLNAVFFAAVACAYSAYLLAIVTNVDPTAPVDQSIVNWMLAASCALEIVLVTIAVVNIRAFTDMIIDSASITADATRSSVAATEDSTSSSKRKTRWGSVASTASSETTSLMDVGKARRAKSFLSLARHFGYIRLIMQIATAVRAAAFLVAGIAFEESEVKFGYVMWACAFAAMLVNLYSVSLNASRGRYRERKERAPV